MKKKQHKAKNVSPKTQKGTLPAQPQINIEQLLLELGDKLRKTPDGSVSVFDLIQNVTDLKNPRRIWDCISTDYVEVVRKTYNFKFKGSGQRNTPVCNPKVALEIIYLLSGPLADKFRSMGAHLTIGYLEGDIQLADAVMQRNNNQDDLEWLSKRTQGKITRFKFTDTMRDHGAKKIYGKVTQQNNYTIIGASAKDFREAKGVEKTRDGFNGEQLTKMHMLEMAQTGSIKKDNAYGDPKIDASCTKARHAFREFLNQFGL